MATATQALAKPPATRKPKVAAAAPAAIEAPRASKKKKSATNPAPAAAKPEKAKKPKVVRDSFTMPKTDYAVLDALKARAAKLGRPTKKSEVLRAGIQALAAMGDAGFLAAVNTVPAIKTGRPAKA